MARIRLGQRYSTGSEADAQADPRTQAVAAKPNATGGNTRGRVSKARAPPAVYNGPVSIDPERLEKLFYLSQIVLGGAFIVFFWRRMRKDPESGFRVREADLRKDAAQKGDSKRHLKGPDLANARYERPAHLALPGIRIDGPPHEVLGVRPSASEADIQKAYRERMKRYHPDKIGPQGSREWKDAQKIAEAINRAKEELLSRRRGK